MTHNENTAAPIGVFDSGVGGLTVLKAIREAMPAENFVYLGDTARLPYGTKSPTSIARYAAQATAKLLEYDIKMLVVACNTASAVALEALQASVDRQIRSLTGGAASGASAPASGLAELDNKIDKVYDSVLLKFKNYNVETEATLEEL